MENIKYCRRCKTAFDIATNFDFCYKCRKELQKNISILMKGGIKK